MTKWQIFAATGLLLVSAPSWAFFKVDVVPPLPGKHCGGSRVQQLGSGPVAQVPGTGAGVPLKQAANALVPKGWHVYIGKKVANEPVIWHRNENWVEALTQGSPMDVCYVIDWRNHTLIVSHRQITEKELNEEIAKQKAAQNKAREMRLAKRQAALKKELTKTKVHAAHKKELAKTQVTHGSERVASVHGAQAADRSGGDLVGLPYPHNGSRHHIAAASQHTHTGSAAPVIKPHKPVYVFSLQPGPSLEKQLAAWAKHAHWRLIWKVDGQMDWPVVANATFGTHFTSAVEGVMQAMRANGKRIYAQGHGNRVVLIKGE